MFARSTGAPGGQKDIHTHDINIYMYTDRGPLSSYKLGSLPLDQLHSNIHGRSLCY